jgi:signal transduction histidine kinase
MIRQESAISLDRSRPIDTAQSEAEYERNTRLLMTLRQLKWITLIAPVVAVAAVELVRTAILGELPLIKRLVLDAIVVAAIVIFHAVIFRSIRQMKDRLQRQNNELLALHSAGLDVAAELSLETVLKKVVELARQLVGARYGALSVIDESGQIKSFITAGITTEQRQLLGPPPVGHGVLGVVLHHGKTLRTTDLTKDPRSVGFPSHHPEMKSLVAVPIVCKGPFRGNLYLTEKENEAPFTPDDEQTLVRFAVQAAIAIDNAHLHERVADLAVAEERLRIAHEMHDGVAQVLAYVNTKVQAVNEYLKRGKTEEASIQLRELASTAREAYIDVRESIVGLRTLPEPDRPLASVVAEYIDQWKGGSGAITQLTVDPDLHLRPNIELQVVRILQEALANVRKHARATTVDVILKEQGGTVILTIRDDGIGFSGEVRSREDFPRFGLATMRERAQSIGASLDIDSTPGVGTTVRFRLPQP